MDKDKIVEANNAIELNLLDTSLTPDRLIVFQNIAFEEGERMMLRMFERLGEEGFTPEETVALLNNVIGSVSEHSEAVQEAMKGLEGEGSG